MISEASVMIAPGLGGNSTIEEWRLFAAKEKAIYAQLNCFEGDITLRANAWYPASEEEQIRQLLIRQSTEQQSSAMLVSDRGSSGRNPPTYIRKNELTGPFQDLVDTYGVPRYGEANPALLTLITFPFLFGVMYGDIGHGLMLFGAGLYCVFNADSLKYAVPGLYQARYMLCMMGFFAIYAGFMYNDLFSLGLNIFGTRWTHTTTKNGAEFFEPSYDVKNNGGSGPYPFGLDPTWHGATNELLFVNSLKMKISVLFGVAQMIVGVVLRWMNSANEGNLLDFLTEGIPMMTFMICFFGYMDYMILYKWVTPMDNPPSIINSLICMAMGQEDKFPLYPGAIGVSQFLMFLSVLSVPVMLIPKPLVLYIRHQSGSNAYTGGHDHLSDDEEEKMGAHEAHGHKFEIGEVAIHQIIETIEFVLGTVSHTASYLRLWALSLAHQQLSLVFFQKTIMSGMVMSFPMNAIAIFFLFGAWFGITVAVLMGMDVLECFLHTLRLHWVEFQSKFYRADGYLFQPFRHKAALEPTGEQ
jgi:V-type H+-transporting ATPase subunit a